MCTAHLHACMHESIALPPSLTLPGGHDDEDDAQAEVAEVEAGDALELDAAHGRGEEHAHGTDHDDGVGEPQARVVELGARPVDEGHRQGGHLGVCGWWLYVCMCVCKKLISYHVHHRAQRAGRQAGRPLERGREGRTMRTSVA